MGPVACRCGKLLDRDGVSCVRCGALRCSSCMCDGMCTPCFLVVEGPSICQEMLAMAGSGLWEPPTPWEHDWDP
jgi:hypothetical protein